MFEANGGSIEKPRTRGCIPPRYRADRFVQDLDRGVGLLLRQHEWRRQADGILPGAEDEQAALEALVDDAIALGRRALLGLAIAHELDADHQPATAHVADDRDACPSAP